MKQAINIVWFKRDLRLSDHQPLQLAIKNGLPIILLYIFEPSLLSYGDSAERHWRFVYQSLQQMQKNIEKFNSTINIIYSEAIIAFQKINDYYSIQHIFSHEETGNQLSFDRDKSIHKFCTIQYIKWGELPTNGVIRGLKNRNDFNKHWHTVMHTPLFEVNLSQLNTIDVSKLFASISENEIYLTAWKKGETGYPLIDACMKCVIETGYLNFRCKLVPWE